MNTSRLWAVALGALAVAGVAQAQAPVPELVNFNARLTDSSGVPVSGSHQLQLQLFDAATGGTSVWTETTTPTFSATGTVSVELGGTTPLTAAVFTGAKLYLQITVDGTPLTPRVGLVSVPYALRAGTAASADRLGGLQPSDVQRLVTGTCATGQAIRVVNADGTVVCDTAGGVTSVTGAAPLSVTNGTTTPAISIAPASSSSDGYLSAADWTSFNNRRQAGGGNLINWMPSVSSWALGTGTSATITLATSDALEGDSSFEFFVPSGTTGAQYTYGPMIPVDPRRPYEGRISAKYISGGGTFSAGIEAFDAAGTSLGTRYFIASGIDLTTSTSWREFVQYIQGEGGGTKQFPAGTRFVRPRVVLSNGNIGATRIDAFHFAELSTPIPPSTFYYYGRDGQDYTTTGWTNLAYASFTGTKFLNGSRLKITWTDSFRTIAAAGASGVCGWQLFVNGASCSPAPLLHVQHDTNSAPSADNHRNVTVTQICTGVGPGPLVLQVAGRRRTGNEDCYRGYDGDVGAAIGGGYPASILVEEIP